MRRIIAARSPSADQEFDEHDHDDAHPPALYDHARPAVRFRLTWDDGARVRAGLAGRHRWALAVGLLFIALVLAWSALHPALRAGASALYGAASGVSAAFTAPLNDLRLRAGASLLAPLLLGLMGATAPCQLSTGAAALAFVARDVRSELAWPRALAYLAARVTVYLAVGLAVLYLLGGQLQAPTGFLVGARRALGPLMLVVGLVTLGVLRPRIAFGAGLAARLARLGEAWGGQLGAFALGLALSFSFCPTLFFLFFGLTLPLALTAPLGALYPAVFALGMTLPLLVLTALLPAQGGAGRAFARGARRWHHAVTPLAGALIVLAGAFDTFVYWLM